LNQRRRIILIAGVSALTAVAALLLKGVLKPPAAGPQVVRTGYPDTAPDSDSPFHAEVPKVWSEAEIQESTLPNPNPKQTPRQINSEYYYRIRVDPIYQSYPLYHPKHTPPGYLGKLRETEPKIIGIDWSALRTKEQWIKAGELVFTKPLVYAPLFDPPPLPIRLLLGETDYSSFYFLWHDRYKAQLGTGGTVPALRIFIREKGALEAGLLACSTCHTRTLADGRVVYGAQGQFPNPALGFGRRKFTARRFLRMLFSTPWLEADPLKAVNGMNIEEIYDLLAAPPLGVITRHGTSPWYPVQVPDLIGVRERRYLDHTGLGRHRGIADLMRYAAMNQTTDTLASYTGYVPATEAQIFSSERADAEDSFFPRYSDEELYALSLYVYALQPPMNPNLLDETAKRGQQVFEKEGCGFCHTPPLYTNNKLTPVKGFKAPIMHLEKFDILNVVVGTDPNLALKTRRATGYYKVPSLKGVWYRSYFGHSGWCATLEDWLDPARLGNDYVPSGFKNIGASKHAVPGHEFGLWLSPQDKAALIAFLKTL